LPDVRTWESRGRIQQPLTRAELAILLAYSKNWLKSALATAELFNDKQLLAEAQGAFPFSYSKKLRQYTAKASPSYFFGGNTFGKPDD
jgi:glutamate dehydrogenase